MSVTAFLFPGQGSQSAGMLAGLAGEFATVRETFEEASEAIGFDLWALCQNDDPKALNQTINTQPAMLAADIATWRAWTSLGGPAPIAMAGHSLGEYAALVASGSLAFPDAMRLVRRRGQLMQEAVPAGEGAMAAVIGLDDTALERLCEAEAGDEVVSCANYNAPGQVVIAGHRDAVERTCQAARDAGARRALPLPVSVPSHCVLMRDAAGALAKDLAGLAVHAPDVTVLHNADVRSHGDEADIRDALARQLWQPVRWTRTVEKLVDDGVTRFAECGPGRVLTGLNRRISRSSAVQALESRESMEALMEELAV